LIQGDCVAVQAGVNVKAAIVVNDREVFAANRAVGHIALTVGAEGGKTREVTLVALAGKRTITDFGRT
jgi:urease beta subunit